LQVGAGVRVGNSVKAGVGHFEKVGVGVEYFTSDSATLVFVTSPFIAAVRNRGVNFPMVRRVARGKWPPFPPPIPKIESKFSG